MKRINMKTKVVRWQDEDGRFRQCLLPNGGSYDTFCGVGFDAFTLKEGTVPEKRIGRVTCANCRIIIETVFKTFGINEEV